jgi:DNA-binding SARP family transcriptional activator
MLKQTMISNKESPLLQYAIQKLNPTIFSHPIWVRFGSKNLNVLPGIIKELLREAEILRYQYPSEACQVLFLCAVCQNYSGQKTRALSTIRSVIALAESEGLVQEILWAKWGACAVRAQQGDIEKAAKYLTEIKYLLSKQNEWMLIDFVDIVRQALLHPVSQECSRAHGSLPIPATENLTTRAVELLDQWGLTTIFASQNTEVSSQVQRAKTLLSLHHLQSQWRSLILRFKGELKLSWGESNTMYNKGQSSFLESIAGFLHFSILHHNIDTRFLEVETPTTVASSTPFECILSTNPLIDIQNSPTPKPDELNPLEAYRSAGLRVLIHMLGNFSLSIQGIAIKLPASRSLSVLKYLLLHYKQNIPREILMEVFWPEAESDKARNNLNVAIHRIRQYFQPVTTLPILCYQDGMYGIAPNIHIWLDVYEFERLVGIGQHLESRNQVQEAISNYEAAISLYQGDFLGENLYEGWTALRREQYRLAYLDTLDRLNRIHFEHEDYATCITLSQLILSCDRCREDAHCILMRCYCRQGQNPMALRQYQVCVEALQLELEVAPAPETTKLYEQIRQHKRV